MLRKTTLLIAPVIAMLLLTARPADAWWRGGHQICTRAALSKLPEDMPEFFRKAEAELAQMSPEPDEWKNPSTPHLRVTEQPEHFLDLEYLDGKPFPKDRPEFVKLMVEAKQDPFRVGMLPYAMQENYERLMLAFRDYRAAPDNKFQQAKILVYAGWLAHYAEDCGQPLHTTKNFDGRPEGDDKQAHKGIHARVDGYLEKFAVKPEDAAEGVKPEDAVDVWPLIAKAIEESHTHVDQCYELDKDHAFDTAPDKGKELMLQRAKASAQLTATLWYSAWKNSAPERNTVPQK
jgi:hypothetical protein